MFPVSVHRGSFFFFLMIRRPPRSTLFPTRRSSDLVLQTLAPPASSPIAGGSSHTIALKTDGTLWSWGDNSRSEEHTSELQSQSNLVCRLLLEKKKIITPTVTVERCVLDQ